MREHPIIMHPESVRAILDGTKTQTRRVVRIPPACTSHGRWPLPDEAFADGGPESPTCYPAGAARLPAPLRHFTQYLHMPYTGGDHGTDRVVTRIWPRWQSGDRLWVRETWSAEDFPTARSWGSPLFMPRWAVRLFLVVVRVRCERLQSITEEDARAEGTHWSGRWSDSFSGIAARGKYGDTVHRDVAAYAERWDQINGRKALNLWSDNPWVFALDFQTASALPSTTPNNRKQRQ